MELVTPGAGLKDESHCLGFCRSGVVGNHSRMEQLSRDSRALSSKGPLVVRYMAWSTGSVQPTGAVGEMCRNGVILLQAPPSLNLYCFLCHFTATWKRHRNYLLWLYLRAEIEPKAQEMTALLGSAVFWAWIESL